MKKKIMGSAGLLLSCFLLFGCGPSQPPKPPDEVTLQLKWVHLPQFSGFYMAQEKGYYAEENIKVTFLEGGQEIDNAERVISGKADFGVLSPEDILVMRSQGKPLTAIAAIYRRSAAVFVAMADSGIVRPADFPGKTVAVVGKGGAVREFELQFYAMMKKLGLNCENLKMIDFDPDYAAFYNGQADVTAAYATTGLIKMRRKGLRLNLIWPFDYGVHFYSDTLSAAERLISEKPDLVIRFLRATLRGWKEAVEDSQQAVAVTLKYSRIKDPELLTAMMEAMLPLVHTGEDRIGWMKTEVWQGMYQVLLEQRSLPRSFDVNQAYTMRFLKEIYGEKGK